VNDIQQESTNFKEARDHSMEDRNFKYPYKKSTKRFICKRYLKEEIFMDIPPGVKAD
jgi:hypothetical protein